MTKKQIANLIAEAENVGVSLTIGEHGLIIEAPDDAQDYWDDRIYPHEKEIIAYLGAEPEDDEIEIDDEPHHDGAERGGKKSQATTLIELAGDADLFHDPDGNAFARVEVDDHREVLSLRNKAFRRWLARRFYMIEAKAPSAQSLQDAIGVLEGKALYDGEAAAVHLRCEGADGSVWVDLCNDQWQAVEITQVGWRVISSPPILFRRSKAMLSLPSPATGGSIDDLREFVNVSDDAWPLVAGWIAGALRPRGPYAVLAVHGEQGSAKSSTCRLLRSLIDPNSAPLRSEPREPRDLAITANNNWIVALDNLSVVRPWLSDGLCRLATGGGFATRALFENDEEAIFDSQRATMLNGIEELANRSDLLDRCVMINLPRIDTDQRITESDLWARFDKARPRILGALFSAVAAAIKNLPTTVLANPPRMADFAQWATAAEPGLGLKAGEFVAAYAANRAEGNDLAIEANAVGKAIMALADSLGAGDLDPPYWSGTATELIERLGRIVDEATRKSKAWPASPRAMSGEVKRLAPNLRAAGVEIEFARRAGGKRIREIIISKAEHKGQSASPSSRPSQVPDSPSEMRDASRDARSSHPGFASHPSSRENCVFPEENEGRDARDAWDTNSHLYSNGVVEDDGVPF